MVEYTGYVSYPTISVRNTDKNTDKNSVTTTCVPRGDYFESLLREFDRFADTNFGICSPLSGIRLYTLETPKRVIYNPPATVVFWPDGTKTVAKCEPDEPFDREKGLMVALLKRIYGNRRFHDIMEKHLYREKPEEEK